MQNKSVLLSGSGIAFVAEDGPDGVWNVTLPPVSALRLLLRRTSWNSGPLSGRPQALGFAEIAGRAVADGLMERLAAGEAILGRIAETKSAVRMAPDDSVRACLMVPLDPSVGESATKGRCLSLLDDLEAATEVEVELVRDLAASASEMRLDAAEAECAAAFRTDSGTLSCRSVAPEILAETLLGMIQLSVNEAMDEDEIRSRLTVGGVDGDQLAAWLAGELWPQVSSGPAI